MRALKTAAIAAILITAFLSTGCAGDNGAATSTTTGERSQPAAKPPDPAHFAGSVDTYSGSTRTTTTEKPVTLVNMASFGWLTVSCTRDGGARTAFTLSPNAATALVVVEMVGREPIGRLIDPTETLMALEGPAGPMRQSWHITPITGADVPVATVNVASVPAPAELGGMGCFASAQAVATTANG